MFLSLQVFPFPDVLECCLVLLHLESQCPPELHQQALDLLRNHGSASTYKKAGRRFLTWRCETSLSSLSCMQLLNIKAVLSWRLVLKAVVTLDKSKLLTSDHQLLKIVLENWKAGGCGLELYAGFFYQSYLLEGMLMKALAIFMWQKQFWAALSVFQQWRNSRTSGKNTVVSVSKLTLKPVLFFCCEFIFPPLNKVFYHHELAFNLMPRNGYQSRANALKISLSGCFFSLLDVLQISSSVNKTSMCCDLALGDETTCTV